MTGWRTRAAVSLLGLALTSCGPSPGPIASTQASGTYELVCGDMQPFECEEAAAAFAADILESNPGTSVVRISFAFGMIDAELSNGIHVSSHLEPPAVEGLSVNGRFYALMCWGVDSSAVSDEEVARGSGLFEETRPIVGLPPDLWLAVRGERLPCSPRAGAPLEFRWYLVENTEITVEQRRDNLVVFRAVTTEP